MPRYAGAIHIVMTGFNPYVSERWVLSAVAVGGSGMEARRVQDPGDRKGQRAALEGHMKALAFRQLTVPSDVLQHVVEGVERTLWLLVSSPFLCWFGPGGSAGHLSQHRVRLSVYS
jgi:hypothetical protein